MPVTRLPVPSSRTLRWLTNVVIGLAVVAFGVIMWTLVSLRGQVDAQQHDLHRADTARRDLAAAVDKQQAALEKANRRLVDAGKPPVTPPPTPSVVTGPQGVQGVPGPPPTSAAVLQAVTLYCAVHSCSEPPSDPQVAAAVAGYCANGRCQGAAGPQGATGAQGPQGPGPTETQIAAAVANYCSTSDRCRGTKGDPGEDGQDGTAVPGDYTCESGQYVTGFAVASNGAVSLHCAGLLPPGQAKPSDGTP